MVGSPPSKAITTCNYACSSFTAQRKFLRLAMGCTMTMRRMLVVALVMALALSTAAGFEFCNMTEDEVQECKPAVTATDPSPPTPACCTALAKADLTCICSYRNSLLLLDFGISAEQAIQVPAKCGLTIPAHC